MPPDHVIPGRAKFGVPVVEDRLAVERNPIFFDYEPVITQLSPNRWWVIDPASELLEAHFNLVKSRYRISALQFAVWGHLAKGVAQTKIPAELFPSNVAAAKTALDNLYNDLGCDNAAHAGLLAGIHRVDILGSVAEKEISWNSPKRY